MPSLAPVKAPPPLETSTSGASTLKVAPFAAWANVPTLAEATPTEAGATLAASKPADRDTTRSQ